MHLHRHAGCLVAAALSFSVLVPAARAEEAPASAGRSKWSVDLEHPERGIPTEQDRNADPLQFGYWLQDLTARASGAADRGDHATAARLYEALALAVPDRAIGLVKACGEYEALGDMDRAVNACGGALLRDGLRVSDYVHFVELVLAKPGDLSKKDEAALGQVLAHMREDPAGRSAVDELECRVGARTSNVGQLEECTANLAARAPEDVKTVTYTWALAVAEERFDAARAEVVHARAAGVPETSLTAMDHMTAARESAARWRKALGATAALLVLGTLAFFATKLAARRRLARPGVDGAGAAVHP